MELRKELGEAGGGGRRRRKAGVFGLTYFDPGLLINQGGLVVGLVSWARKWFGFGFINKEGPVGLFSLHKDHLCNFWKFEGLVLTTFQSAFKGYS